MSVPMIDYAPGTKLSYITGREDREGDSSVVVLREGGLLEVRRGTNTFCGDAYTERRQWDSVEEWLATLPAGAKIMDTTNRKKAQATYTQNLHPDIQRIMNCFTKQGHKYPTVKHRVFNTLWRLPTRSEHITDCQEQIEYCMQQTRIEAPYRCLSNYHSMISHLYRRIDDLRTMPASADVPTFLLNKDKLSQKTILYGQMIRENTMKGIYICAEHGKFAVKDDKGDLIIADNLSDFTFQKIYVRVGPNLVRL